MKETWSRLISELMKNSRRSDRELAKVLNVSQPTVSRSIKKLEEQGLIKEYTMIPDFAALGFELMAFTFISIKPTLSTQEIGEARRMAQETMKTSPGNILLLEKGIGLNHTGVMVSLHKNYSEYAQFIRTFKQAHTTKEYVDENVESFLVDLKDKTRYRPLSLSMLANHIVKMNEKKK